MNDVIFDFLLYFLKMLGLTLGILFFCGFAVRFFSRAFARVSGTGSGDIFDITAIIGTPIHELGHAVMCLLFGHKITRMKLWSPSHESGVYGFVEHTYSRKNLWAKLGCLFIGVGPIFSGLAVIILMLWICFPVQWDAYLTASREMLAGNPTFGQFLRCILSLLGSMFTGFGSNWVRSIIGVLVILPVSLHITLSWQDVKSAAGAMPLYLLLLTVFTAITMAIGASGAITEWFRLLNLRAMSLFCIVIAFSAVWVVFALVLRGLRIVASWF